MSGGMHWDGEKHRGEVLPLDLTTFHRSLSSADMNVRVFFDMTALAPAPSRDYFRLRVTMDEVELTQWNITHGSKVHPISTKTDLQDFPDDKLLKSEVIRIFGESYYNYIVGLSEGKLDMLLTMPTSILVKIIYMVGIENLHIVAPVCQRFRQITQGDQLWKLFFEDYAPQDGSCRTVAHRQSQFFPWKTIFLVHHLQDHAFKEIGPVQLGEPPSLKEGKNSAVKRLREIMLLKKNQNPVFPPRLIALPMSVAQSKLMRSDSDEDLALLQVRAVKSQTTLRDPENKRHERYRKLFGGGDWGDKSNDISEPIAPNEFFDKMYPSGYSQYTFNFKSQ